MPVGGVLRKFTAWRSLKRSCLAAAAAASWEVRLPGLWSEPSLQGGLDALRLGRSAELRMHRTFTFCWCFSIRFPVGLYVSFQVLTSSNPVLRLPPRSMARLSNFASAYGFLSVSLHILQKPQNYSWGSKQTPFEILFWWLNIFCGPSGVYNQKTRIKIKSTRICKAASRRRQTRPCMCSHVYIWFRGTEKWFNSRFSKLPELPEKPKGMPEPGAGMSTQT